MTDSGREYLQSCRRALRVLNDGGDLLQGRRTNPGGVIKVACPIHMSREALAPLMKEFLRRFPDLRVEIETYASGWDQEPREDVDLFFKLRAPKDSLRRVRPYPGTVRGLFASREYVKAAGTPKSPDDLAAHSCIGYGVWKLSRGEKVATPNIAFRVVSSDPTVNMKLAVEGLGIVILPLYMAKRPEVRASLVPILPDWSPEPITLCALFFDPSHLTPKVQVLLDFLTEYLGTDRDPRLPNMPAKGFFTDPSLPPTSGPAAFQAALPRNIEAVSQTGEVKIVQQGGYYGRYLPSGHLVYMHQGVLFGVAFDLARLEARGSPLPLLEDVAANPATGGDAWRSSGVYAS